MEFLSEFGTGRTHCRPRTEPEAVGRRRAVSSAFADFLSIRRFTKKLAFRFCDRGPDLPIRRDGVRRNLPATRSGRSTYLPSARKAVQSFRDGATDFRLSLPRPGNDASLRGYGRCFSPRSSLFHSRSLPVQSLDLGHDHCLRGSARGITRRQSIANLFEMLKPHRDMERVQNRRFQDTSTGENTPGVQGQPSVKAVSAVSPVPPTASRFFLIIPSDVRPSGLRDAAENPTAAGFRFDIANSAPQTDVRRPLRLLCEGGIHGGPRSPPPPPEA